ncbi:divalent metal cation transporter [Mesorhizobium sp. VK24D]|uniref:Divalent metal cation transporter n=1 Tax=Mesorhizobium album TaxID=3072314 RepID=A0ABU4Y577_9HYPH|nr:divalent metal cation transporter [Mesorhizobium sp. VK24D]MDX8482096.1 divalent metal cation transporter [Mesorhizobium sp. VK24D]
MPKARSPQIAGSAAYAVAEMFRWPEGLDRRPREAKAFYATIAAATLGSIALSFTALYPIRALHWSAVINGILVTPLMAMMVMMVRSPRITGRLTAPWWWQPWHSQRLGSSCSSHSGGAAPARHAPLARTGAIR